MNKIYSIGYTRYNQQPRRLKILSLTSCEVFSLPPLYIQSNFSIYICFSIYIYTMTLALLQAIIHYSWHFLLPWLVAYICFRKQRKLARIIMVLANIVDIDHLRATPIFDPDRCSIWYHTFHTYITIGIYILMLFVPHQTLRILAVWLLLHMIIDRQDCFWM